MRTNKGEINKIIQKLVQYIFDNELSIKSKKPREKYQIENKKEYDYASIYFFI